MVKIPEEETCMYYITNGKVLWRIDSLVGEWYKQGVFTFTQNGWNLIKAGNIAIWYGWLPGTCGELIPKTKKAKMEFKKLLKEARTCGDASMTSSDTVKHSQTEQIKQDPLPEK